MKKNNKKGFTIVELVIVIAVIAILAAVLIPTFSSIIKKAKVNNDIQLVRNLNTALATENKKHKTMQDALDAAAKFGYDVTKINASATDNEILWDSVNDVFCYLKDGKIEYIPDSVASDKKISAEADYYKLWKIYGENDIVPAVGDQTYSIYLNGASYTVGEDGLVVCVGFDAGNQTDITGVTYKNTSGSAQNVIIRTNGNAVLSVNGYVDSHDNTKGDVIHHYGQAGEIQIIKCAMASYHEFGSVDGNINLAYGRVELESGSSISNVVVKTLGGVTPTEGNVKVTVEDKANATLILSEVSGVSATVEGAGAANVPVLDSNVEGVAAIGATTYATLKKAISAAKGGDTIVLLKDAEISSVYKDKHYDFSKDITIDLNGRKLIARGMLNVSSKQNLTVKNGEVISNATTNGGIGFQVKANAGLTLSRVSYSGACFGIYPSGDASYVNVLNSSIRTIAGIATNANGNLSNNVKITIESSTIDCTEIAVWINVPGACSINESVLMGGAQALMVRAGTAVVSNSRLIMHKGENGQTLNAENYLTGSNVWGQGNSVPCGALIVGDYSTSYDSTASCTLINTQVSTTYEDFSRGLIVLSQDGANETILNYDSACGIARSDYVICDYTVSGLKKGLISVNNSVVRERDV